jgi:hypothetical protein
MPHPATNTVPTPDMVPIEINPWIPPEPVGYFYATGADPEDPTSVDTMWTAVMVKKPPAGTPDYLFIQAYFPPPSIQSGTDAPDPSRVTITAFDPFEPPLETEPGLPLELDVLFPGAYDPLGWTYPAHYFPGNVELAFVINKPADVPWPPLIQIQITIADAE